MPRTPAPVPDRRSPNRARCRRMAPIWFNQGLGAVVISRHRANYRDPRARLDFLRRGVRDRSLRSIKNEWAIP
jgi:hypothetical protein